MLLKAKKGLVQFGKKGTQEFEQAIIKESGNGKYKLFYDVDANGLIDYGEREIGEILLSKKWQKKVKKKGVNAIKGKFKQSQDEDVFHSKKAGSIVFDDPIMYGGLEAVIDFMGDTVDWANEEMERIRDEAADVNTANEVLAFTEDALRTIEPNNPIAEGVADMLADMQDQLGAFGDIPQSF